MKQRALVSALVVGGVSWLFAAPQTAGKPAATIRRVAVLGGSHGVEIEVTTSQPITPQTQVVTGPDRLVIDFPNATPGSDLHNLAVNRGEVKAIRVGLFTTNPPVTRVVLDLKTAQPFQIFPSGKTVIVKLSGNGGLVPPNPVGVTIVRTPVPAPQPVKPASRVEVEFRDGRLTIWADRASLAEVLYQVHRRTGADIPIPAGAEQEEVVASFGPGPAREVMAALLNGSRFNFIMVGSDRDPSQLKSVLLSPRGEGVSQPATYSPPPPVAQVAPEAEPPGPSSPQPDIPPEQQQPGGEVPPQPQ